MQESDGGDGVQAVFEGGEGGGLREEHEQAVEAFVEVGVAVWFEELEAEICDFVSIRSDEKRLGSRSTSHVPNVYIRGAPGKQVTYT